MGLCYQLGQPVEDRSGLRRALRWRLLLAHDATASTCNPLLDSIGAALGEVDISESSSVDDALLSVGLSVGGSFDVGYRDAPANDHLDVAPQRFHLALVCLDLPPAPLGGVRLAQALLERGVPVILVTRSLRWIPPSATSLHGLPWIPPDAGTAEVSRAVGEAMSTMGQPRGALVAAAE